MKYSKFDPRITTAIFALIVTASCFTICYRTLIELTRYFTVLGIIAIILSGIIFPVGTIFFSFFAGRNFFDYGHRIIATMFVTGTWFVFFILGSSTCLCTDPTVYKPEVASLLMSIQIFAGFIAYFYAKKTIER